MSIRFTKLKGKLSDFLHTFGHQTVMVSWTVSYRYIYIYLYIYIYGYFFLIVPHMRKVEKPNLILIFQIIAQKSPYFKVKKKLSGQP